MIENILGVTTPEQARSFKDSASAYLAGGTEINRLGSSVDVSTLIDIRKLPGMKTIGETPDRITIGPMCTFQELLDHSLVPDCLKQAIRFCASRTKRNMATIGGNIALRRDDSYLIPTLLAADAWLDLETPEGSRQVSVQDYVGETDMDSLILQISIPKESCVRSTRSANTAESHARLTAAMALRDGRFHIAAAIKHSGIHTLSKVADALSSDDTLSEDAVLQLTYQALEEISIGDDIFGSAAYKRYLLGVTLFDMYRSLLEEASKGGASL